jgi:TP901 family phage tail tape measure protein
MSRMSLDTAIRLSAEVKGGGAIDRVKRSLQDFGKTGQTSKRDLDQLRAATFQFSRANDQTIAGIRNSINAFRGLQEQARIGSREFKRYGEEIQRLEAKLSGLDGTAQKAGASLGQKLATGLAAAGVGRALQGITAQAGRFDAELRKAAAIEGGSGSFDLLRKEIEAVAAAAAGTPTEVAALATALSRAGFSAEQTSKALRGIVLGAEATDTAFDQMGGIVGTILKTFQMDASQTASVVDVMVKSANSANQTVTDVGEAMSYAAGQASALGVSFEDSAALIALFADASVRGSRAGTALSTGLNRLQIAAGGGDSEMQELIRGSGKMADAMSRLGASVLDAEGKLRPLDQVLITIKRQIEQFGTTDRAIIAKALFGEESGRSFQAVLQRSEADIIKMFRGVNNAGGTAEQTQKKMQGFDFAVKVLGGNVENLTNQIGGMIGGALLPFIRGLNGAMGAAQKLPEPLRRIGSAAAAAGVSTLGLVAAITALKVSLGVVTSISAASAALKIYTGAATGAGVASATAATRAGMLLSTLTKLGKIGLIVIGVKFAIEGLDELITGLVGVRDAEASARAMAERRGLTYVPSAAVTRRRAAGSWQDQMFGGRATGATAPPATNLPPTAVMSSSSPSSGTAAGGGGGGGRAAAAEVAKGVKELLRLTDAEITAAVNTAIGEYGGPDPRGRTDVFANILARSRSSQYPSNLVDVVTQPGQYAPNFGRSRAQVTNPNLYGRSRFDQVKAELMNPQLLSQSIRDVDSRLYFKGISQYPNMVPGVDFLRAQGQNFFHGPGRTDPGRNPQITTQLLQELGGGGDLTGYLDEQQRAAEQLRQNQESTNKLLEEFLAERAKVNVSIMQEAELLNATTDLKRRKLEYLIEQDNIAENNLQIRNRYLDLSAQLIELGIEHNQQATLERIEAEKTEQLINARLKYEQDVNDLLAERGRMMREVTNAATSPTAFNPLEQQKADLDALLQKYPAVGAAADAAANLATRGFSEMVTGARSAKEVFADFLRSIADALIETAKTMIAQYIAIGIARMFAGIGGGGGANGGMFGSTGPFGGGGGLSTGLSFDPSGFAGRAIGGPVSAGQPYMVGERGPELMVPYQSGSIIPADVTQALSEANSTGIQPLTVPFQKGTTSQPPLMVPFLKSANTNDAAGGGVNSNEPIRFESVVINEVEYVTRREAEAIGRRSEQRTLKRIQNNPTARAAAGIR